MSARGVNKVIIVGHLGQDPEVHYMPNGNVVTGLNLATSETWRDKQTGENRENTEWHRIVLFGKLAELPVNTCVRVLRCISKVSYAPANGRTMAESTAGQPKSLWALCQEKAGCGEITYFAPAIASPIWLSLIG